MFRKRIKEKYPDLTTSFCKLARFIEENEIDVAFMTATELASRLGVDAATVVRFAQELGYSGYRELSKEIQAVVRSDLKASYAADIRAAEDLGLFRGVLENERNNLKLAQHRLTEEVNSLLPLLLDARRIWVLGQGHCSHLATLCAATLREVGLPAVAVASDPLSAATSLKEIDHGDLAIGFTLREMDMDTANAVRFAREQGAATVAFSASPVAGAALQADISFICPGPTQTEYLSFGGLAVMISAVAVAFTVRYPGETAVLKGALQQSYGQLLRMQAERAAELEIEAWWRKL
ncbi:MAG: MurR/RpiR family transcriptional regulator [Anaerolineae bacterium]